MKKFISVEFLWFVFALLVAIPMGFIILRMIGETSYRAMATQIEQDFIVQLYFIGVAVSFVGVYIARIVAASVAIFLGVAEKKEE